MKVHRGTSRRGFSLLEVLLVITGLTIVIVLCGSLLHMIFRLDRAGRNSMNDTATVARLARQFRQDVRSSPDAKPGETGSLELTQHDGRTISYRVEGTRLVREERDGTTVRRREVYAAVRLGPVRFDVDGSLVRLVLSRRSENPQAPTRPALGIEAHLGKDRTLADLAEARK